MRTVRFQLGEAYELIEGPWGPDPWGSAQTTEYFAITGLDRGTLTLAPRESVLRAEVIAPKGNRAERRKAKR